MRRQQSLPLWSLVFPDGRHAMEMKRENWIKETHFEELYGCEPLLPLTSSQCIKLHTALKHSLHPDVKTFIRLAIIQCICTITKAKFSNTCIHTGAEWLLIWIIQGLYRHDNVYHTHIIITADSSFKPYCMIAFVKGRSDKRIIKVPLEKCVYIIIRA